MVRRDFIVEDTVVRELGFPDFQALGMQMDAALAALGTGDLCQDEATLAHLMHVESLFYIFRITKRAELTSYDGYVCPALDHIVPACSDARSTTTAGTEALRRTEAWPQASYDYHSLVTGPINAAKEQMAGVEVVGGRFVFFPATSLEAELRNRWFARRWRAKRFERGRDILKANEETRRVLARIDGHVGENLEDIQNGFYRPPQADWYERHCRGVVDRVLERQFQHVADDEVWGGLRKDEVMACARPMYVRAARKVFAHLRAYKMLIENLRAQGPVLTSNVDSIPRERLVEEVAESSGLPPATAARFVESLVRRGKEERHGVLAFPLLPLTNDRFTYLPSALLHANWPQLHEKAVAADQGREFKESKQRVRRHSAEVTASIRAAGFALVGQELVVKSPHTGDALTDLDVVVVGAALSRVLVLQLKSFLIPTDLLTIERATRETKRAVEQCRIADDHRASVERAIKDGLRIDLQPDWTLHQIVVVEAITGTDDTPANYPAVSLEWITSRFEGSRGADADLEDIWRNARELPDAAVFRDGIAQVFELFDPHRRPLKVPTRAAVFAYLDPP